MKDHAVNAPRAHKACGALLLIIFSSTMTTKIKYIVVRIEKDGALRVCSDGPRPFIGPKEKAQDLANFLKSVNPSEEYVVYSTTPLKAKGSVVERYSGGSSEKTEPKKRRRACDQGATLRN